MNAGELPPRLRQLKAALIAAIPCAPDEEQARADLASKTLGDVIKHYMAWVDRLISRRPRRVEFASDFWKDALPAHLLPRLAELMQVFTTGGDLSPYLSRYAQTHGYVQQFTSKRRGPAWADGGSGSLDFAVNMFGIHHLHFTPAHGVRRKGQSDALLFASVQRDSVRFLMVGDHRSFDSEALRKRAAAARHAEGMALKGVAVDQEPPDDIGRMLRRGFMATETVNGEVVPLGLTALDGTSLWTVRHVSKVMGLLHDYDAKLDTPVGRSEFADLMNVTDDLDGAEWQFVHGDFCLVSRSGVAYVFFKWMR
jgi:hypothetical protein